MKALARHGMMGEVVRMRECMTAALAGEKASVR